MLTTPEETRLPTRFSAAIFGTKARLLQLRRAGRDVASGVQRHPRGALSAFPVVIAESRTPLWNEGAAAERELQRGKVQNLRCALRRLNGTQLPADGLFSFWKQIGQATRQRGYVPGRLLREGCLMPAVGGGLCQLSNALYDVALQADLEIVERYAHSRVVPGSAAEAGRDATVAWNYIDLRFRSAQPIFIEAQLTADELVVRLRAHHGDLHSSTLRSSPALPQPLLLLDVQAHSCTSCAQTACFRHQLASSDTQRGSTAYLVDELWPEFQQYLDDVHQSADVLGIPLPARVGGRYKWNTDGYARVSTAAWQALLRSRATRWHSARGAARLQAQLRGTERIARRLAGALNMDVTRLCVAQSLLPFLWRDGHLGGRSFEVLMTRLPLQVLQQRLDSAHQTHPERATLGEFRAPPWLVEAESAALSAAERIVTPHSGIAALFRDKVLLLDWHLPAFPTQTTAKRVSSRIIVFPGPTAARKGAYELRSVARALDLEIVLLGSELETENFWDGVRVRRPCAAENWLDDAVAVVQPALVEERPAPLLRALSRGVPIIATTACGLGQFCNDEKHDLHIVPHGDEAALQKAIENVLAQENERCKYLQR